MTQVEKDALLGRMVRRQSEADAKLALLKEDANQRAAALRRLSDAISERQIWRMADHCGVVLNSLKSEGFDFSKISEDSIKGLVSDLQAAEKEEAEARQARISACG